MAAIVIKSVRRTGRGLLSHPSPSIPISFSPLSFSASSLCPRVLARTRRETHEMRPTVRLNRVRQRAREGGRKRREGASLCSLASVPLATLVLQPLECSRRIWRLCSGAEVASRALGYFIILSESGTTVERGRNVGVGRFRRNPSRD